MKATLLQAAVILTLTSTVLHAQLKDIEIKASRTKLDQQRERAGNKTITSKEIAYDITIQNKTFKTLPEIVVKYAIYYTDSNPGSNEKPPELCQRGKETISNLEAHRSTNFETKPFKLSTAELDPGWYYTSGAGNRSKDAVTGVWIKAFVNGEEIAEYANPSTISKKKDWKE